MNIILVSRRHGHSRTLSLPALLVLLSLLVAIIAFSGIGLYQWVGKADTRVLEPDAIRAWQQRLVQQSSEIERTRSYTEDQIRALAVKLAELQARLTRLDAMGERLVEMSDLEDGEFDFSVPPAVGGPEEQVADFNPPDFVRALDELSALIENREQQLEVLNALMGERQIQSATFVAGRPIERGWLSSRFGYRNDPFNGRLAWHNGIDFAGPEGSNIIAVAAGIVTVAREDGGYGYRVDINHSNGYVTRYAHAKELLVQVGDIVKKGDVIALMGNTGRSTGPHVHFEVHYQGDAVDPAEYIHRVVQN
ncbi:MAG: M23 family metallopeptidase [Saccharospirillum sp.]